MHRSKNSRNWWRKERLSSSRKKKSPKRQGGLFFGGVNGFTVFNPNSIRSNPHVPDVVITSFQIFNKERGLPENLEVELNNKQNFISFKFAALNYTSSEKNQYAYQLEGVDAVS